MLAAGSDETMRQNRAASSPAGRLVCSRMAAELSLYLVSRSWQMASAIPASPSVASARAWACSASQSISG